MLGIEILNICNFKCYFCDSQYVTSHRIMTNNDFFNIADQAADIGITKLDLTPIDGELFADTEFIEKLEYVLPNFEVTFHTNFSLCTFDIQDKLKELQNNYNIEILISDYYCEGLEAFKRLTGKREREYNNFIKYYEYSRKIGLKTEKLYRGEKFNYTIDDEYEPDTNKQGICTLQFTPRVQLNGDVDYCLCGDGTLTSKQDLYLGNIYTTPLRDIYYSNKRLMLYKDQSRGIYNKSCLNCDLFENGKIDIKSLKHYTKMRKSNDT